MFASARPAGYFCIFNPPFFDTQRVLFKGVKFKANLSVTKRIVTLGDEHLPAGRTRSFFTLFEKYALCELFLK